MNITAITGVEPVNSHFNKQNNSNQINFQGNLLKSGVDFVETSTPKVKKVATSLYEGAKDFLTNLFRKNDFELNNEALLAETYYRDAGAKLNGIALERSGKGMYNGSVNHNIDAYNRLPQCIKDGLKPSDVGYDGSISQHKVNQLYSYARESGKISKSSYAPTFYGRKEEEMAAALQSGEYNLTPGIENMPHGADIDPTTFTGIREAHGLEHFAEHVNPRSTLELTDLPHETAEFRQGVWEHFHAHDHVEGFDPSTLAEAGKEHAGDIAEAIADLAHGLIGQ